MIMMAISESKNVPQLFGITTEPFQIFTMYADGNTMWQILNNQTLQSQKSMRV